MLRKLPFLSKHRILVFRVIRIIVRIAIRIAVRIAVRFTRLVITRIGLLIRYFKVYI